MTSNDSKKCVWTLSRDLPSVPGAGEPSVDLVCEQLESQAWPDADVFAMRLAMSEALANAVEHGNKRDADKTVHLAVEVDDKRALVSVGDEGKGFNFADISDPTLECNLEKISGRGLFLIRNFMTNVWHNDSGNVIYMEKRSSVDDEDDEAAE